MNLNQGGKMRKKEEWDIDKILFIVHLSILVIGIFGLIGVGIYASITFDQREEIGIVVEKGKGKGCQCDSLILVNSGCKCGYWDAIK